ncbi:MAG TPA: hypothetical protein VK469_20705 [Candidatus Kapabacteria bacterium]|nr:hypothetical protein [Candidatus Kapabacteria bacterium]
MEQLIIEVNSHKNMLFLSELLKKFDFITSIEKLKPVKNTRKNDMPIEWAKKKGDIMALAGIWKAKPRSIEEIREKAWKRD